MDVTWRDFFFLEVTLPMVWIVFCWVLKTMVFVLWGLYSIRKLHSRLCVPDGMIISPSLYNGTCKKAAYLFLIVIELVCIIGLIANRSLPCLGQQVCVMLFCHVLLPYMKSWRHVWWISSFFLSMCILQAGHHERHCKLARCSGIASTMVAQLHQGNQNLPAK